MLSAIFDQHNVTVAEVAKKTGINRATLYNWNRNPKSMSFYGAFLIVRMLNTNLDAGQLAALLFADAQNQQLDIFEDAEISTDGFVL